MKSKATLVIAPATFGYGPAAHAISIARALRNRGKLRICGLADGPCIKFLEASGQFDQVIPSDPDRLPDEPLLERRSWAVFVAVTDFARPVAAKRRGLPVIVVDALYWMWQVDPMDVALPDAYLCLDFPGVVERIAKVQPPCESLKVIPQIAEPQSELSVNQRSGLILNFGGGVTPFGFSYDYCAAVVQSVQLAQSSRHGRELLVTCSDAARAELETRGIVADIRSLSLHEMARELQSRAALVTLPGLSIMRDALNARIPTFLVPGVSYSQHQLVKQYLRYFLGVSILTWNDLPGYRLLPPGMAETDGVREATRIADGFAKDRGTRLKMTEWLSVELRRPRTLPTLTPNHPWGDFSGADHVADQAWSMLY